MRREESTGASTRHLAAWRDALAVIDVRAPSSWPAVLRHALCVAVFLVVLGLLGIVWLAEALDLRDAQHQRSVELGREHERKRAEVKPLAALASQRAQAQRQVNALEGQLVGATELDGLLADIHQAGAARGLQFALLRPDPVMLAADHAEQPVALRLTGRYHDIGTFAADLARLPHLVNLGPMVLEPQPDGLLAMTGTVRVFRRLDAVEQAARKPDPAAQEPPVPRQEKVPSPASRRAAVVVAPLALFTPAPYLAVDTLDPFDARKLARAQGAPALSSVPSPGLDPLEAVPLDAIEWVGRMRRAGRTVALVEVERKLHVVHVGQHLGPDRGRVAHIGDDTLIVNEQVQDTSGAWVERQVTLHMRVAQKEKKK
ncbi:pilus assembly protein PilP [Variovorax ginsengisoli]|uniref:Tfp pilus assembly protein PilO/Tfp pilus assembly protein PilP n=1 Tax=Variovorax ginsengisoli TaxID=363844 RepID=A0ABT9S400_9BURK|nr:pilus assembly protein PilP [Variovorax ginsengisoli]MDP9898516.1 Tfp pilus assembly protein PilO/Tfp pilus assembly protein PilP [Variovorax ginsengisoli]